MIPQGNLCRRGLNPPGTFILQGVLYHKGLLWGNGSLSTKLQLLTGGGYYNEKYYSFLGLLLQYFPQEIIPRREFLRGTRLNLSVD